MALTKRGLLGNSLGRGGSGQEAQPGLLGQESGPLLSQPTGVIASGSDVANLWSRRFDEMGGGPERRAQQQQQIIMDAVQKASQRMQAGDTMGALEVLAPVAPAEVIQSFVKEAGLENQFGRDIAKAQQTPAQKFEIDEATGDIIEISGAPGQATTRRAGKMSPKMKEIKEAPLSQGTMDAIDLGQASVSTVRNMNELLPRLIEQNKVGPLQGRKQQVLDALGLSSKGSAEYQGMIEFFALGEAARQNKGRPTDPDRTAAEKTLAKINRNPDAALGLMAAAQGRIEADRDRTLLNQLAAATPEQLPALTRLAKQVGFDVARAKKLRTTAAAANIEPSRLQEGIILLRQFEKTPNLSSFAAPDIKRLLSETARILEETGNEDLLD